MSTRVAVMCLSIAVAASGSECAPTLPLAPSAPASPVNPIVRMGVGESVPVTLGPADFVAFDQFGDSKWERVIFVTSNETLTVETRIVLDDNTQLVDPRLVFVGITSSETAKNCGYGARSVACTIPANGEIPIVITLYPGPGVTYSNGQPAVSPTFTVITRRVEQ